MFLGQWSILWIYWLKYTKLVINDLEMIDCRKWLKNDLVWPPSFYPNFFY